MIRAVELDAPAKVNLRLEILAREASGYHTLETVFCALDLADRVRVVRAAPGIALRQSGDVDTGPPERNLALRAAQAFYRALGEEGSVEVELEKRIPSAAGLGGGSADAAAVLRALNALHGEPLGGEALLQLGAELGADVPFFLCGAAFALAWGRGERLLALPPLPPRPVLLAHPGAGISTADAFARLAQQRGERAPRARALPPGSLSSWEGVAAAAMNDFEPIAASQVPAIGAALACLRRAGAAPALLAGSGSSVFGVFVDAASRDAAAGELQRLGLRTWRSHTLTAPPHPLLED